MKVWKRVKCALTGGHQWQFLSNIADDDRAAALGARSIWNCACGATQYRRQARVPIEIQKPWYVAAPRDSTLPPRETTPSCPICCAKKGEPHTPECTESGLA